MKVFKAFRIFLQLIGCVVFAFWLLGVFDLLDFYLCIGAPDTCTPPIPALMEQRSTVV